MSSFRSGERDPALGFALGSHRGDDNRIAVADRGALIGLARKPACERRVALILSTYLGKAYQMAHAVGLDALASVDAIVADLAEAGYKVSRPTDLPR